MIQSVAGSSAYAFDSPARFGVQSSKPTERRSDSGAATSDARKPALGQISELTPEQQRQVQQLKEIDRKVRAHEQAHLSVGGDLVRGGATFSYQTGPDNKRYAVGGEVSIDASPGRTPEETIPKAQHIRATALAPADPSAQDQSVAARAGRMEGEARMELAVKQGEEGASASRSNTDLYLSVEKSTGDRSELGVLLDSFA
jgi:hypothetical protein